jgi:pyruvate-formate lyase-activating enzyme
MILVNPAQGSNQDVPNMALGYADVSARVIDLNTGSSGALEYRAGVDYRWSVTCKATCTPEGQEITRSITVQDIEVQCSYRYVALADNLHVGRRTAPDYHRFTSYDEFSRNWRSGRWAYPVFTSFGCPYLCEYCAAHRTGWTARPLADLADELKTVDAKVTQIADACLNLHTAHVLRVCEVLSGRTWMATNGLRADRLSTEQAAAMSRSGCETVAFGVEYPEDSALQAMSKGETLAEIERGIRIAKDHFPSVSVYLISGFGDDQRALDWAAGLGVYVHLSKLNTTPFEELPTDLASPNRELLGNRYRLLKRYGTAAACRFLRMDLGKIWRRAIR